ncbi:META domain-containing protein [Reyranella sp.]|uniref:META domain-containing protein n=1 Tax=Reyranella sp. TaxID=1929291 RepID=UPI00272F9093|nr:META domain-containing protein [Reyranella sp.]MDP2372742.1 META domain-containing protein [Reyranella sp.]
MKNVFLTLTLLSAVAGIAMAQTPSSPPPSSTSPAAPREEGQPPGPEVRYVCPGGTDFSALFSRDGDLATLMVPGQPEIDLPRQRSGSGFAYGDSYYELRGRGREATLTAAGRSMRCHAAGRPGDPPRTFAGPGLTVTLFPDGTFRLREARAGGDQPLLDLGQWTQEVDGGVRLVLRGSLTARRAFRQVDGGRLIADDGTQLVQTAAIDKIDGRFRLEGLYRDAQDGGLFAECFTGRTFAVAPRGAEPDLERAWVEAAPSRDAQLFFEIVGRFADDGQIEVERVLNLKPNAACPPPAPRSAALRGTEWRVLEIDGERVAFGDGLRRPRLTLGEDGKFSAMTGCNTLGGSYTLDPDGLRFIAGPMTMMACAEPSSNAIERRFIDALAAVTSAQIAATALDLKDASGKLRLRLEARGR